MKEIYELAYKKGYLNEKQLEKIFRAYDKRQNWKDVRELVIQKGFVPREILESLEEEILSTSGHMSAEGVSKLETDQCRYISGGQEKSSKPLSRTHINYFPISFGSPLGEYRFKVEWAPISNTYQLTVYYEDNQHPLWVNDYKTLENEQPFLVYDGDCITPPREYDAKGRRIEFSIATSGESSLNQRYNILEPLRGKGLWKAEDMRLERSVVIKTMSKGEAQSLDFARFCRAADFIPQVESQHIVSILDAGPWEWTDAGEPEIFFISREYIPGESLDIRILRRTLERVHEKGKISEEGVSSIVAGYIKDPKQSILETESKLLSPIEGSWKEGRLSPREAVFIFSQVCEAIRDLHKKKVFHRNLHPSHILVAEDNFVKIVGLSSIKGIQTLDITLTGESVGNEDFAPHFVNDPQLSDIYGIAAIFAWSLTGKIPQIEEEVELPLGVPQKIQKMIKAVIHDPRNHRITTENILEALKEGMAFLNHNVERIELNFILPEKLSIPGYEMGIIYETIEEVGSDLFNVIPLEDNKFGLLIADTMCHGPKGALCNGMIQSASRIMAEDQKTPNAVLGSLNKIIYQGPGKSLGPTALYGILDTRTNRFLYARAGHFPLLLYRNRTGGCQVTPKETWRELGTRLGMPVKIFNCIEEMLQISNKDIIVLYSDGLIKSANSKGEEYGIPRLSKAIETAATKGLPALLHSINESILDFLGTKEVKDDITVLLLRLTGDKRGTSIFYQLSDNIR